MIGIWWSISGRNLRRVADDCSVGEPLNIEIILTKPHRIYSISVASVYPHYIAKAEKKGRTNAEVDEIFRWLTGYSQAKLDAHLKKKTNFEDFFASAPKLKPARSQITGVICGVRIETSKTR